MTSGRLLPLPKGSDMVPLASHPNRPCTADYIRLVCDEFFELHGDRRYSDDQAILGGPARFAGQTIMLIGHQNGHYTVERQVRNFGMPHPEGFRKALRLMRQAEKFGFPVVCLIDDTPGAFPDIESEERGQARAIAESLAVMTTLRVQVIAIIIGEGVRYGALVFSLADRVLMLEYATCSVASPEIANSTIWHNSTSTAAATNGRQLRSLDLLELGVIDGIISEPPGGAQCDHHAAARLLSEQLSFNLEGLRKLPIDELLQQRYAKFRHIENFSCICSNPTE